MTTLADLIRTQTVEEAEETLLGILSEAGFQAYAWQPKSIPRLFVKAFATLNIEIVNTVTGIAAGGFSGLATGKWLDLLGEQQYANTRTPAIKTVGKMLLTNISGVAVPVSVGQLYATDGTGSNAHRYANKTGGTIAATVGSTLLLDWEAEGAGGAYNIPNGSILPELATPIPGVTVTNPAYLTTGTWITTAGADEESDEALELRNTSKWGDLAPGGAYLSYVQWVKQATPTVTRLKIDDDNPDGPGTIHLWLANAAGGATSSEVTAVNNFLLNKRALGTSTVTASAAGVNAITVAGAMYVEAEHAATAPVEAAANIAKLTANGPVGGTAYLSEIVTALSSPTGVRNVALTSPTADTALGSSNVAVYTLSIDIIVLPAQ